MVLLQPIGEIPVAAMGHLISQLLANRTRIGIVTISRHPVWSVTNHCTRPLKEALRGVHIALLAQHGINQVPVTIDGAIEITPPAVDFHIGLIYVPGTTDLSLALGTQLLHHQGREALLPVPDGFVR